MIQLFHDFASASFAAKVVSYTTNMEAIVVRSSAMYSDSFHNWQLEAELSYETALLVLRFDREKPSNSPEWWAEAAKDWARLFEDDEGLLLLTSAYQTTHYERHAGLPPIHCGTANLYMKDIAGKLYEELYGAEQRADEAYWQEVRNDPHYLEDVRNAERADFLSGLAEVSDSPEEFSDLVRDWDEFRENKR